MFVLDRRERERISRGVQRGRGREGSVIFQQCGAQNFNGLSRVREEWSGGRRGMGPKRWNMRARERDNATGE